MNVKGASTTWLCSRCRTLFTEPRERCPADGRRVITNLRGVTFAGRWLVERLLGVGGDGGSVWQASATDYQRTAAIKVLPVTDQTAAQRFERGARISGMLEHRHITSVIEHGREGDWFFLIMELLEGETLQRYLARQQTLPPLEVASIADQVLQALEYAHAMNVIHRDIKPANIFVSAGADGRPIVKLLDFGIAKQINLDDQAPSSSALLSHDQPLVSDAEGDGEQLHITQHNQILGTPEYMAPEQIIGARLDARTDLYALGVLLYRALAGRLPFEAKTRVEMYKRHLYEPPPPFPTDTASPDLEKVILSALAKKTDDRWGAAADMRRAIVAARSTIALTPTARTQRPVAADIDPTPTGASTQADAETSKGGSKKALWLIAAFAALGVGALALSGALSGQDDAAPATSTSTSVEIPPATPPDDLAQAPVPDSEARSQPRPSEVAPAPTAPLPSGAEAPPTPARGAQAPAPAMPAPTPAERIDDAAPDEPADDAAPAPVALPVKLSFKVTSGGVRAQVLRDGQALGYTPFDLELLESELPVEVTVSAWGYRTATRRLTHADAGAEVGVALQRLPAARRPDGAVPKRPGAGINLER